MFTTDTAQSCRGMATVAQAPEIALWHYTDEEIASYYHAVDMLRGRAGLPKKREKTVTEAIRDNSFAELRAAIHCELFDNWPLREQMEFLESVSDLPSRAVSVRIYEQVFQLLREARTPLLYD